MSSFKLRGAKLLILTGLCTILAACGFEMRGNTNLPSSAERIHLTAPAHLYDEMELLLSTSNATLVPAADQAQVLVQLSDSGFQRSVLSVDPETGKEREFELSYAVTVSARNSEGKAILPSQSIGILRDYVFDPDSVIGKSREENTLRTEMRSDALQQALFRVERALHAQ